MLATISQSFDIYIDIMWQELDWEIFITQQSENFNVEERLFFNNDFFKMAARYTSQKNRFWNKKRLVEIHDFAI